MSESVVSETQGMEWGGGQGRNRQTKVVTKREGEVRLYLLLCDDSFGFTSGSLPVYREEPWWVPPWL